MKLKITFLILISPIILLSQNPLSGFKILKMPRDHAEIGAEWIDGTGPNGKGVNQENISISKSFENYSIDKSTKISLDASIMNYFNINSNLTKSVKIEYHNLKIFTIKDLYKTNLKSGQKILYEYIKADSISIYSDLQFYGDIKLKIEERFKSTNITNTNNIGRTVKFSGDKLILAYRVFEILKPKVITQEKKLYNPKYNGGGFLEINIMGYNLKFNMFEFNNCINQNLQNNSFKYKNDIINSCCQSNNILLILEKLDEIDINGNYKSIHYLLKGNTYKSDKIVYKKGNEMITDAIELHIYPDYLNVDNLNLGSSLGEKNTNSKIKISRIITQLKIFPNPTAQGW